ncbi:MAG: hypothetical protein RIB46_12150 [Pseudomonadales bacterium]
MAKSKKADHTAGLLQVRDLSSLSAGLTALMSDREHHSAIESLGPKRLASRISELGSENAVSKMKAAAELARLSATMPKHASEFAEPLALLIDTRPQDLDSLDGPNEKFYFASALSEVEAEWIAEYCVEQALREDQAERVRKRLLERALKSVDDLEQLLGLVVKAAQTLHTSVGRRTPDYRIRKVIEAMAEIANESDLALGRTVAASISDLVRAYQRVATGDDDGTIEAFEGAISILVRVIQTRMSLVLESETFASIPIMKAACQGEVWRRFLNHSKSMRQVKSMLLDAVTILAGQDKTDREFIRLLEICFESPSYLQDQLADRLSGGDIDPESRHWWIKLGKVRNKATGEQRADITVDQQLALLILRIDAMHEAIDKLRSDVAPILHISDPILSPVITTTASHYEAVARTVRQLCRIRKLELMGIAGARVDFNPRVHEFVSGDQKGERKVRVVRDGVFKSYGGSVRPILKAQVEPIA